MCYKDSSTWTYWRGRDGTLDLFFSVFTKALRYPVLFLEILPHPHPLDSKLDRLYCVCLVFSSTCITVREDWMKTLNRMRWLLHWLVGHRRKYHVQWDNPCFPSAHFSVCWMQVLNTYLLSEWKINELFPSRLFQNYQHLPTLRLNMARAFAQVSN